MVDLATRLGLLVVVVDCQDDISTGQQTSVGVVRLLADQEEASDWTTDQIIGAN